MVMFIYTLVCNQQAAARGSVGRNAAQINNQNKGFYSPDWCFFSCFLFFNSLPFGVMGATSQRAQCGEEGGREEATERGTVSSHSSIKSVGNDQD